MIGEEAVESIIGDSEKAKIVKWVAEQDRETLALVQWISAQDRDTLIRLDQILNSLRK